MPKSKRAKVVHLSKVDKKGKALSVKTYTLVQENVSKHPYIYIVSVDNMRNNHLKEVRAHLSDSKSAPTLPIRHHHQLTGVSD